MLLLGQLVSLQSSYWWWKSNQKNSHKGLRFSGEPPRCLMPFYSVPTTTITLASEQQSLPGVSGGPWLDLLVVRLNMEFAEPKCLSMKHQKIDVILKCSFGLPTSLCITLHLSWHLPRNSCWFIGRGERCNVLLWLPFHFAWSKWVNYEMEAGFWTEANWPVPKTGPIWEQSPTDISAVQICYGNEYHCCLGGPASELKWWMTASRQISPPDVRLSQSAWTSVKINMKEKCCLTTQTWLPADLLVLITGWHFWSVKAVFSAKVEGVEIIGGCFSQVVITSQRGLSTWGRTEFLLWSCKILLHDCVVTPTQKIEWI